MFPWQHAFENACRPALQLKACESLGDAGYGVAHYFLDGEKEIDTSAKMFWTLAYKVHLPSKGSEGTMHLFSYPPDSHGGGGRLAHADLPGIQADGSVAPNYWAHQKGMARS